jgi:hypothetical protein
MAVLYSCNVQVIPITFSTYWAKAQICAHNLIPGWIGDTQYNISTQYWIISTQTGHGLPLYTKTWMFFWIYVYTNKEYMKFSTALSIFSIIPQSVLKSRLLWRSDTIFIQMLVWTSTGLPVLLRFECPSLTLCGRNPKPHYMLWPNSTKFFVTRLCNGLKLRSSLSIAFITYRNNTVYQRWGKKIGSSSFRNFEV